MTPRTARLVVALVIGAFAAADAVPAQLTGQARRIGMLAVVPGHTPRFEEIPAAGGLELVVNLKTAKALGVTVQQSILVRADRVIE